MGEVYRADDQRLGQTVALKFLPVSLEHDQVARDRLIAEVRSALADRAQADVPILTIAMDAGFGSLVMFNRVFKERQGETPSAFRRRHLDG